MKNEPVIVERVYNAPIHPELAKQNFVQGWEHFIGTALKEFVDQDTEE